MAWRFSQRHQLVDFLVCFDACCCRLDTSKSKSLGILTGITFTFSKETAASRGGTRRLSKKHQLYVENSAVIWRNHSLAGRLDCAYMVQDRSRPMVCIEGEYKCGVEIFIVQLSAPLAHHYSPNWWAGIIWYWSYGHTVVDRTNFVLTDVWKSSVGFQFSTTFIPTFLCLFAPVIFVFFFFVFCLHWDFIYFAPETANFDRPVPPKLAYFNLAPISQSATSLHSIRRIAHLQSATICRLLLFCSLVFRTKQEGCSAKLLCELLKLFTMLAPVNAIILFCLFITGICSRKYCLQIRTQFYFRFESRPFRCTTTL